MAVTTHLAIAVSQVFNLSVRPILKNCFIHIVHCFPLALIQHFRLITVRKKLFKILVSFEFIMQKFLEFSKCYVIIDVLAPLTHVKVFSKVLETLKYNFIQAQVQIRRENPKKLTFGFLNTGNKEIAENDIICLRICAVVYFSDTSPSNP